MTLLNTTSGIRVKGHLLILLEKLAHSTMTNMTRILPTKKITNRTKDAYWTIQPHVDTST